MSALDYVVIAVFFALVVYFGYLFKQVAGNTRNFFLAGRSLVHCYVNPKRLRQLAEDGGETIAATFERLLPTKPALKSGDFGEMLTLSAIESRDPPLLFPLPRWRTRPTNDATVMGVDLVGYAVADPVTPSPDDILVLCEVKTRSSRANRRIVRVALDSIKKDFATRIANQLLFQQMLLRDWGMNDQADRLTRFRNPHAAAVPYRKRIIAGVVHDRNLWKDEFLDELPQKHQVGVDVDVEVALVVVEQLATWISEMRVASIAAAQACADGECGADPQVARPADDE